MTTYASYDDFKLELRRLESEQEAAATQVKQSCKPAVAVKKNTDPELKTRLQKLNDRIDALKNRKTESAHEKRPHYAYREGFRGQFQSRDRGFEERQNRFSPGGVRCFICNEAGHLQHN